MYETYASKGSQNIEGQNNPQALACTGTNQKNCLKENQIPDSHSQRWWFGKFCGRPEEPAIF